MKVAIVGSGFCGLAVAWHLLNLPLTIPNRKVVLLDGKGIGKGASGISAGLLHPYAGAHAKLNWRGQEGFLATKKLLEAAEIALGRSSVITENKGILRLALNEAQHIDFQRCAHDYPEDVQWLDEAACQTLAPGCARAAGILIGKGIAIDSALYLQGLWQACSNLGAEFKQHQISSLKELEDYDLTIIATGAETIQIPELSALPLTIVKGQILELAWPAHLPPLTCSLNSHVYLLMTCENRSCLVGATYEKGFQTAEIDLEKAKKELLPKLYELYPPLINAPVLKGYAGLRSVTPQHRPMMHRLSPSQWVLSGMGSKGLLYHALLAEELVKSL